LGLRVSFISNGQGYKDGILVLKKVCNFTDCVPGSNYWEQLLVQPFKDEAQTALFKDPVRTAL
jgi:hypothetical protein